MAKQPDRLDSFMDEAREPDPAGGSSENRASKPMAKGMDTGDTMHDITALAVPASQSKPQPAVKDDSRPAHEVVTIGNATSANKAMAQSRHTLCLLDLPVELRIMIAEYALTDTDELDWSWTSCVSGSRSGTFLSKRNVRLVDLTALRRVSKQLCTETAGLVWKWNTFNFGRRAGLFNYRRPRSPWSSRADGHLRAAVNFFLEKAPPGVVGCIRNISIFVKPNHTLFRHCLWTDDLAERLIWELPNVACVKITLAHWTLNCGAATWDLEDFIGYGRKVLGHRQKYGDMGKERKGRFFPYLTDSEKKHLELSMKQEMGPVEIEEVMGWVKDGI
ncbi:hypothetical protein IQ07DRAFT_665821 [Pyrenochaeta sp. DS3sAY3a]|nr:hypothetical protein IQ07DRAFT_665821 [Pyrenochaeta sp. DS3sAY3a]